MNDLVFIGFGFKETIFRMNILFYSTKQIEMKGYKKPITFQFSEWLWA